MLQTLTELVIETPSTGDRSASASGLHRHTATDAGNIGNEFENAKKSEPLKKEEEESLMNKLFSPLNAIFFGNKTGIKILYQFISFIDRIDLIKFQGGGTVKMLLFLL